MNNQYSIDFPSEKIKLKNIYRSKDSDFFHGKSFSYPKIEDVYGDFSFPLMPKERTYTLGSFVPSLDGKIAFPESPDGTLVAKGNARDPNGALADYWILNLLRTVSDPVLMGSKTILREPELTGHIFDSDLVASRIKEGKPAVPLHIIVTGSGNKFPVNHKILQDPDIPVLIVTTEKGKNVLAKSLDSNFIDLNNSTGFSLTKNIKAVISIDKDGSINLTQVLTFLKKQGIDTIMIESPQFLVSLMQEGLLDELYLNTSSI
ncbi:MAG: dihydrofolate reductase family protein, partial [Spirochaetales bacterium]|nr:dihydrofolate reductase family protein [Spirochaetales bacterium]